MKKFSVGFAVLAYLLVPQALQAQDGDDGPPETVVVAMATVHVPLGEPRGKFMEFVERVVAPQAKNNPNVLGLPRAAALLRVQLSRRGARPGVREPGRD
jgi:hypothetical protein